MKKQKQKQPPVIIKISPADAVRANLEICANCKFWGKFEAPRFENLKTRTSSFNNGEQSGECLMLKSIMQNDVGGIYFRVLTARRAKNSKTGFDVIGEAKNKNRYVFTGPRFGCCSFILRES